MLGSIAGTIGAAVICFAAGTRPSVAAQTPVNEGPDPSGNAHIAGRVLASSDDTPVREAVVRLSGGPAQPDAAAERVHITRQTGTDDRGAFAFAHLPAGTYLLYVEPRNGFVPFLHAREATVADGATARMTIAIERTGAIAGRISGDRGDPTARVEVEAIRRTELAGEVRMVSSGSAATDQSGNFRIDNLSPGDYLVVATEIPRVWNVEPARQVGTAPTYYPGGASPREAVAVSVRGGRDMEGVNFALTPCRLARLAVAAFDSKGDALGGPAGATLTTRGEPHLRRSTRQASRLENGTLVFTEVPPGHYVLGVYTSVEQEEAAYVDITVDGADVAMDVQTNAGARVSGRAIVEGGGARTGADLSRRAVVITAFPPFPHYGPSYARVPLAYADDSDFFALTGLRGPMVLTPEAAGGAVVSLRRGGEEIGGKTLQFTGTETWDDLVVVFTTDVAGADLEVIGTAPPERPERTLVVLFADDPARWHDGVVYAMRYTSRVPTRLQLGRKAPGRYHAVAVANVDLLYPTGPRLLERLRRIAVPVTLVAGQTARAVLPVVQSAAVNGQRGGRE